MMCKRERIARRADKWWRSVYLRQMLMSDRPTIKKESSNDRDHRKRTQVALRHGDLA